MHIRERQRVDIVMVARGLAPSRQKARDIISNSSVMVDGKLVKKAGQFIRTDALISLQTFWIM